MEETEPVMVSALPWGALGWSSLLPVGRLQEPVFPLFLESTPALPAAHHLQKPILETELAEIHTPLWLLRFFLGP